MIASLTQQLSDRVELFAQGYMQNRSFDSVRTGSALNLVVPSTNAFFVNPAGTPATSVTVAYNAAEDLGGYTNDGLSRSYNGYAGLNIDLGGTWRANVYASYGHNDEHTLQTGFNTALLNQALADSNPATAFNPFGDGSFTNPATLARIRSHNNIDAKYDRKGAGAKIDGNLFAAPGGAAKLAVGVDYYHDRYQQLIRNSASTPDNSLPPYNRSDLRRDVKALFAEVYVPLVGTANAMTGVQSLTMSLAARMDEYSDFGRTTNPKVGLDWVPVGGLKLNASFGKAYRAPTPSNLDNRGGEFINVQDFSDAGGVLTRGLFIRGGNPDLGPETAKTYSLGVEFTPDWSVRTRASLNYFNVKYEDQISAPGTDPNVLTQPLLARFVNRTPDPAAVAEYMTRPSFQGLPQDPTSVLVIVDGRSQNTSSVETDGLEGQLRFDWDTGIGAFNAGIAGLYLLSYDQALVEGAPLTSVVGTLNNPQRFMGRLQAGWSRNAFNASAFVNYSSRYSNKTVTPIQRISSYTTVDASLGYDFSTMGGWMDGLRAQLNAQNLFDETPPPVFNGVLAFDPQVASALGRMVSLEFVKRF